MAKDDRRFDRDRFRGDEGSGAEHGLLQTGNAEPEKRALPASRG
jgi:hypothetical protein